MKRKEDMCELFLEERKKKRKKGCHRQTAHQLSSHAALGGRGRGDASNETIEQHIWSPGGATCVALKTWALTREVYIPTIF